MRGAEPEAAPGSELPTGESSKLIFWAICRGSRKKTTPILRHRSGAQCVCGRTVAAGPAYAVNPTFEHEQPPDRWKARWDGAQRRLPAGNRRQGKVKTRPGGGPACPAARPNCRTSSTNTRSSSPRKSATSSIRRWRPQFLRRRAEQLLNITAASVKIPAKSDLKATIADRQELLLLEIDYNRVKANLENAIKVLENATPNARGHRRVSGADQRESRRFADGQSSRLRRRTDAAVRDL